MPESPATNPVTGAVTGRAALREALLGKPGRAQVVVAVLLFVLGWGAATQVRQNSGDAEFAGLRQSDLIRAFDGLGASTQRAENEIDRLEQTRDDLRDDTLSRQAALDLARADQAAFAILAGTVPVHGPGIRITIEDPEGKVTAAIVLDMIQELRATGAEAMEINDRIRIVAQTSFVDTEDGLVVDGELVEAPYTLDAIGEPGALTGILDFPQGPVERVDAAGGSLDSDELDEVLVESVTSTDQPEFARPDDDR